MARDNQGGTPARPSRNILALSALNLLSQVRCNCYFVTSRVTGAQAVAFINFVSEHQCVPGQAANPCWSIRGNKLLAALQHHLDETHFNFDKEVSQGVLNRCSLQSRIGLQIAPLAQAAY
jgi:hypothetical protein